MTVSRHARELVERNAIDSKAEEQLGTIIGDGAKTGINTMIYPGRKLWPNATTLPGEAVTKDVM